MTTEAGKVKLPLVEKFLSIQGEGYNAGRLAFFIRFSGCNLDCVFADGAVCDTPWRGASEVLTVDEVLEWMAAMTPSKPLVILTGGEPTIAKGFSPLVRLLKWYGYPVAVESNGTTWNSAIPFVDHFVVSPKDQIQHANPKGSPELHDRAVDYAHEYRVVITGPDDFEPILPVHLQTQKLYLSPALMADGTGLEYQQPEPPKFVPGAVERCLEIIRASPRWRLSLQTHKWIRVR